jgi:hypothetical protein
VEVCRSVNPKSRSTQRREEDMDTEAALSRGADPELLATMRALATSIQTMQVDQRCTNIFLQAVHSNKSKANRRCVSVLRGVPHCGLRRHQRLRPMRCFVRETHLASQLPIEQQMSSVEGAFPTIFRFLMTMMTCPEARTAVDNKGILSDLVFYVHLCWS